MALRGAGDGGGHRLGHGFEERVIALCTRVGRTETRFFQRKLLAPSRNNVKTERTGVGVAFFSSLPKDSGHDGALRLTKLIDSAQTVTTWGVQRRVYSSLHTAKTRPR